MATVEVVTNPAAGIGLAIVLLVSATAFAFLGVLFLCGFTFEEVDEASE